MGAEALIPLAVAGVNQLGNYYGTGSANSQNLAIMREQQRWSEEQWQREMAYNSPQAQMARLRQAGINPALAYANGGIENTTNSTPDAPSSPNMIPYRMDLDPNMFAQVDLMSAQAESLRADAAYKTSLIPEAEQRILESKQRIENYKKDIEVSDQKIKESIAVIQNLDEQNRTEQAKRQQMEFDKAMKSKEFDELVKLYESEINRNNADAAKARADAAYVRRQLKELVETFGRRLQAMDDAHQAALDAHNISVEELNKLFEEVGLTKWQKETARVDYERNADIRNLEEQDRIYHFLSILTQMLGQVFSGSVSFVKK